jgi:monomeric sarcosine oxidase
MNNMNNGYSHIIIGAGGVGAAAAFWLSEQGAERVLVLEQFGLMNTLGASGDHSRIIRHAYHSPVYTALTRAMFAAWDEIERRSALKLYTRTGGLDLAHAGTLGDREVQAYKAALEAADLPYEDLTIDDVRDRYPQWQLDDDVIGLYQEAGGLLDIRKSVSAHTSLALAAGVEFRPHTTVEAVALHPASVSISTRDGTVQGQRLIVAAGSWLPEIMSDLGLDYRLTLSQEQVSYFSSAHLPAFSPDRFPVWIYHGEQAGDFYGFPVYGEAGIKLGRDMRARFIRSQERCFEEDESEVQLLSGFLERHLPDARGPVLTSKPCVYEMPPDRDFVLDTLPDHPHVVVFTGAGHAAKFASLMGQILADLATNGTTRHPIEPFRLNRPAIIDPDFEPVFQIAQRFGTPVQ